MNTFITFHLFYGDVLRNVSTMSILYVSRKDFCFSIKKRSCGNATPFLMINLKITDIEKV